ncbi:MAG: RNA polymerase subunit sigma [Cytophagaceae bacterium]|nr:RNA polymerase subunit sigma [Cytophagaceae bacterium]
MIIEESNITSLIKDGKYNVVIPVLYKKVLPLVQKTILKQMGNKEDAFDVFQEALIIFYRQVLSNTYQEKYKVFGFVYRVSLNLWINKIKRDKRMQLVEDYTSLETAEYEAESITAIPSNFTQKLLQTIGDKCQEVLQYAVFTDIALEDLSTQLEYPSVSALKMQIQRCKQKLKDVLKENPDFLRKLKERDFND